MAKAADKAPRKAQANQSVTEPKGSGPPTDCEATKTLTPAPRPAADDLTAPNTPDQLRLIQLLVNTAGKTFGALTSWLTHEQKHMRVLGWITWLFLLGAFAFVLTVLLFVWDPVQTIVLIGCSTGVVAGTNLISRHFRRPR